MNTDDFFVALFAQIETPENAAKRAKSAAYNAVLAGYNDEKEKFFEAHPGEWAAQNAFKDALWAKCEKILDAISSIQID